MRWLAAPEPRRNSPVRKRLNSVRYEFNPSTFCFAGQGFPFDWQQCWLLSRYWWPQHWRAERWHSQALAAHDLYHLAFNWPVLVIEAVGGKGIQP